MGKSIRHKVEAVLALAITVIVALWLSGACKKQVLSMDVYSVEYELTDGVVREQSIDTISPTISLLIDGPDRKVWTVTIRNSERSFSFSVTTGKEKRVEIPAATFRLSVGIHDFELKIFDQIAGDILYNKLFQVVMVDEGSDVPITGIGIKRVIMLASNDVDYIGVERGESITIEKGVQRRIKVQTEGKDKGLSLKADVRGDNSISIVGDGQEDGEFQFILDAFSEGTNKVECLLYLGEELVDRYVFYCNVVSSQVGPPGEEKSVSLSMPICAFVGKESYADVAVAGFRSGDRLSVSIEIDGVEKIFREVAYNGSAIRLPMSAEMGLKRGWHTARAIVTYEGGYELATEKMSFQISSPSFTWSSQDGASCSDGLKFKTAAEKKYLLVNMDCKADAVKSVKVTDVETGQQLAQMSGNEWKYSTVRKGIGERKYTVAAETDAGVFDWTTSVISYDVWNLKPLVESNKIYGTLTGPTASMPVSVTLDIKLSLCAYIPYQEAVIENGEHIEKPKGKYVDIGYEQSSKTYSAGTTSGKIVFWDSDISNGISYGKNKVSKVEVTKNGASRWTIVNGSWKKEYYTPTAIPHIDLFISGVISGGSSSKYVLFSIDYTVLESWLNSQGYNMRGRDIWEWR